MNAAGLATLSLVSISLLAPSASADEATASAPPLTLTVTPGTGGGPWKLRVENTGELPVRLTADERLLVLEVTPPASPVAAPAKKIPGAKPVDPTVRCTLPQDARPRMDGGRDLVIPGKRAWSQSIDPLFFCFTARERAALVKGATVKARFGWAPPPPKTARGAAPPPAPPFVASPVGAAVGKLAPAKEIESASFTLTEDVPRSGSAAARTPGEEHEAPSPLTVTAADALDVSRGGEISTTLTVTNDGDRAIVTLLRADMFRFAVAGPAGSVACGAARQVASPIRELYATLAPKARTSISVLVSAACAAATFDEPGVYRITPILDTTGASGRTVGLRTWDGQAEAKVPLLLRVRTERRPPETPARPTLE
ncbi:MAG: hypothetical protein KF819_07195 [Labilithrix sp.]|nr:hypothetical protein [Labilithrix sp.]